MGDEGVRGEGKVGVLLGDEGRPGSESDIAGSSGAGLNGTVTPVSRIGGLSCSQWLSLSRIFTSISVFRACAIAEADTTSFNSVVDDLNMFSNVSKRQNIIRIKCKAVITYVVSKPRVDPKSTLIARSSSRNLFTLLLF